MDSYSYTNNTENSDILNEENYYYPNDNILVNESIKLDMNNNFILNHKIKNSLDLLNLNDSNYENYKLSQKILNKIKIFNFDNKINNEIISICLTNKKLMNLNYLLEIVIYKIIKKYNFDITIKELKEKINFKISHYLKYNNKLNIYNEFNYKQIIMNLIKNHIQKLIKISKIKQRIFIKQKNKKIIINSYKNNEINLLNNFQDVENELKNIEKMCYNFINNEKKNNEIKLNEIEKFEKFFSGKICPQILSIAIIKYFIQEYSSINITLTNLHEIFSISISSISKGIKLINKYFKL
jgi:hypothetical protein